MPYPYSEKTASLHSKAPGQNSEKANSKGAEMAMALLKRGVEVTEALKAMAKEVEDSPLGEILKGGVEFLKESGVLKEGDQGSPAKPEVATHPAAQQNPPSPMPNRPRPSPIGQTSSASSPPKKAAPKNHNKVEPGRKENEKDYAKDKIPRRKYFLMNMKAIKSGLDGHGMNRFGRMLANKKITLPPLITKANGYKTLFGNQNPPNHYEDFEKIVVSKLQPHLRGDEAVSNTAEIMQFFAIGRYQILPFYNFKTIGLNPKSLKDIFTFMNSPELQEKVFKNIIQTSISQYSKGRRSKEEIIKMVAIAYYAGPKAAKTFTQNPSALSKDQYGGGPILSYANKAYERTAQFQKQGLEFSEALSKAITKIESGT